MIKYLTLLIALFIVFSPKEASATVYYVDFVNGRNANAGTATTTAWNNLDQFTENARSAGDIVFVRRNMASTTNVSDLTFTSDGTIANPIIISADNDNLWNDASTTAQTYTVAVATSTFTASAAITGVQAGDWFYVDGDCTQTFNSTSLNQCEYFYEVASVSGTQLRLYLPYKGNQSGSGLTLINLGKNPQWNVASGDFEWVFSTDDYWLIKGLDIRSTDIVGAIAVDASSVGHAFIDTIIIVNGNNDSGILIQEGSTYLILIKTRFFNTDSGIGTNVAGVSGVIILNNVLIDCNGVAGSQGLSAIPINSGGMTRYVNETTIQNCTTADVGTSNANNFFRNVSLKSSTEILTSVTDLTNKFYFEDFDRVVGQNNFRTITSGSDTNTILTLSTSTLRSGGGPTAIEVRPTTNTTSIWDFNKIKLFEYSIYTDTSSKQYDIYFRTATTTAEWTANPTASELWIECEAWAHNTNATSTRKIIKSTGTVDFAGSANWQNLSVTCQPTQEGILYLRGWYAKTKESAQSNAFIIDGTPVIQ